MSAQPNPLADKPRPRKAIASAPGALRCRKKFLRFFKGGFHDDTYLEWERNYKWLAHERWQETLGEAEFRSRLRKGEHQEIATRAVRIESRTNLLFSFEKMALRDAVRSATGAKLFSAGLFDFLHGKRPAHDRFEEWCRTVESLPRKQTRVLTWPLLTVWGFIALPQEHFFLKPNVTRIAAREYGYDFAYRSRPNWATYAALLDFAQMVRKDLRELRPRDMIDIQSFLWVQGSDEYEE